MVRTREQSARSNHYLAQKQLSLYVSLRGQDRNRQPRVRRTDFFLELSFRVRRTESYFVAAMEQTHGEVSIVVRRGQETNFLGKDA
uniref:Kinesin motor domain-containing protein n=1 Tax=Steinernema glaseri TaxID=37863 RepID=A0A1I7Z448_9BILA